MSFDCTPPGWGSGYVSLPWGHALYTGGGMPVHAPYDLFCVGPCGEMAGLPSYTPVTLSGSFYIDPSSQDAVLYSSNGVETSLLIESLVPADYTVLYTVNFASLPPNLSYPGSHRCFVGCWEDSGASVGLWFSQAGIGFGAGIGESMITLPDSYGIIQEGEYYTVLLATSNSNSAVFIHITKTVDLDNGYPHQLRWVLSLPGQTLSHNEGVTVSVLGDGAHPVQVNLDTVCLGTGTIIPDQPPIADAGQEQEARLCTFVQLDGSASYDPEGAPLTYYWRLIDAPSTSAYVFEAHDGTTSPESPPTGYTDELLSGDLGVEHGITPIVAGDVVLVNGAAYSVVSVATGPFVIYIEGQNLPDNLSQATIKLIRQADALPDNSAEKPVFYPDAAGFWKFDLSVNDGALNSVDRSVVVVHVKESLVAVGVTPAVSFMWNYLSDFWRLVEDREKIEVVWSAVAQIVGSSLMALWQVDYNKSLRDIQRSMQRRWLYYDLLIQEPFVGLTRVTRMDNTAGLISGSDGTKVADRTYEIAADLSAEGIQDGDFLVLDGLGYRISKYVPVGGLITSNRVATYGDFPTGLGTYKIVRPSSSTQINFYDGLVVEGDNVLLEVVTKETGEYNYFFTEVLGVSEANPDKLLLDPTPVLSYLDDPDTYAVYLCSIFRRKYVPINERIVDIPRLQQTIKDPPEEEVLHRGVDFFLEEFRGFRCIRWSDVWVHEDPILEGGYEDDPTPPARVWAETTYIENLSTVEANFGVLADFTLDDHSALPGHTDYLSAVRGLWYVHLSSPSLYNVRVGTQILLGLPFAEETGTIQEIRDDIVSPTNTIFVLDETEDGIVRSYSYPSELALEVNPDTGQSYVVGDRVRQFAPLVRGATVIDYKSDPAWFGKFISQSIYSEVQKFHKFALEIEQAAYTLAGATLARKLVLDIRPTYTYPLVIVRQDVGEHDVDVQDTIKFGIRLKLWEGICFYRAFGHASIWDEGDPSPMRMSLPPDGGVPLYDHERQPGVYSGWQSAYDTPPSKSWSSSESFEVAGPPNVSSTPVTLLPTPYSHDYATLTINWLIYRIEAPDSSGNPDTYDTTPTYEVVLRKNGSDAHVWAINLTGLWGQTGGVYFVERGHAVTPNVTITPDDELEVVIRPQGGSSNNPDWSLAKSTVQAQYNYVGDVPVWGHDRFDLCPDDTIEAIIYCDWPGGTPYFDNPLFAFDTPIFTATIVGGHIVLGITPIPWTYDDTLAAGQYGRRVTL